jgi:hypothetical protein
VDRHELAALIEAFLLDDPGRPHDAAAFERFEQDPLTARITAAVDARAGGAETWTTLLPAARRRAEIARSALVARLAAALGVAGREADVGDYYHRMEAGTLPAAGVSGRVLEALARLLDVPVERLRAAGERLTPPGSAPMVFARSAGPAAAGVLPAAPPPDDAQASGPERDEVDELFCGGA